MFFPHELIQRLGRGAKTFYKRGQKLIFTYGCWRMRRIVEWGGRVKETVPRGEGGGEGSRQSVASYPPTARDFPDSGSVVPWPRAATGGD